MKLLAIESSTDLAQVALGDGEQSLLKEIKGVREHSRNMLGLIDASLAEAGWGLADIDAVVFGRGPGSFTGLRVACSLAQGIAYARDLPVYPVSSLASIAMTVRTQYPKQSILALLDARMQQLYWSFTRYDQILAEEAVDDPCNIAVNEQKIIIAGMGFHAYNSCFHSSLMHEENLWQEQGPSALTMMRMVNEGYIEPVEVKCAQPVYIRDKVT